MIPFLFGALAATAAWLILPRINRWWNARCRRRSVTLAKRTPR